ncbi:MAG: hypothetical protein GY938_23700 [Ketobacter sp.]|nr:hypothetical protein [Ketobacter sp.]
MNVLNQYSFRISVASVLSFLLLMPVSVFAAVDPCLDRSSLPAASGTVVDVSSVSELNDAVSNLQNNSTIRLAPGTYSLSRTLYLRRNNVTIMGNGSDCGAVILAGRGMDNADNGGVTHGIWSDAQNLTVMNLTIRDTYQHGIVFNSGAYAPTINSVALINTGTQFIKSNPTSYSNGVNDGVVINSLFRYEVAPPATNHGGGTGYTNGVDVHAGDNWRISGNRFENFHTPDSANNLWNPAILMWNGASGSVVENNVFVDVDRAVAFGLMQRSEGYDHEGGVIRNNMIYYRSGLYSSSRTSSSDGAIIVWNSPNSVVAHNTILTNGNLNRSIEFRFNTSGAQAINNLFDASIGSRNSATYAATGNASGAAQALFVNPGNGDLRLRETATAVMNVVDVVSYAPTDVDGTQRSGAGSVDVGAHEFTAMSPPRPPENVQVQGN